MTLRAPARGTWGALLAAVLAAGCGQFRTVGAPDPCPSDPRLPGSMAQACRQRQETTLTTESQGRDRSAAGRLWDAALPVAGRKLRHAVALDYSGSMYGGYSAPEPGAPPCGWRFEDGRRVRNGPYYWEREEFARLLDDGPLGALSGEEPVHPLAFNGAVTLLGGDGAGSPFDEARGRFPAPLPAPLRGRRAVLDALTATGSGLLPANPAEAPFGDPRQTRLDEVLRAAAALFESFPERDGILWIVTDNIIERAPEGGGEVARDAGYNLRFYESLKDDPRWQAVHAWPVHRGDWLCGSTLMVYGLYYSSRLRIDETAYHALSQGPQALLSNPEQVEAFRRLADPGSPSPGMPFKLKPEDLDVVRLSFVGQVLCREVQVGKPGECRAQIRVENLLHHRQVDSAEVVLVNGRCDPWGSGSSRSRSLVPVGIAKPFCAGTIRQAFRLKKPIAPGASETLTLRFASPPVETVRVTFADHWQSARFDRFLMVGRMDVGIRDLRTSLVIRQEALRDVYGVEQLPALFRNPSTDHLRTGICLPLTVENPSYLISLVLFLGLFLLALAIGTVFWLTRSTFRILLIDDAEQGRIRLRRIGGSPVHLGGRRIGRAGLSWGGAPVLRGIDGHTIRKRGSIWIYDEGGGTERRIAFAVRPRRRRFHDPGF